MDTRHIRTLFFPLTIAIGLCACDNGGGHEAAAPKEEDDTTKVAAVDYSLGRAMNKRLGKGINLGNGWEGASYCGTLREDDTFTYTNLNGETKEIVLTSADEMFFNNLPSERYNFDCEDRLDGSWGNPIDDSYFSLVKNAGFNSVRIPVRWQHNSDPVTHKVNPERLAGVLEDVQKAIAEGLAVIVSFHWYYEINFAANHASEYPDLYEAEKAHFAAIWNEVATAFESAGVPDSMLVWDILNEPTMKSSDHLNEVMTLGYNAIRTAAPGKTIMFESYHAAKFGDIDKLILPKDGNIIYSGHYYEPYTYTHQGHSYPCKGDAAYSNSATFDLAGYVSTVTQYYPDVNGGHVPMNMGEFGVSGGENANSRVCEADGVLPSARMKAQWAKQTIQVAENNDISWHYWGFTRVGGFEAYDISNNAWYEGFPAAFGL